MIYRTLKVDFARSVNGRTGAADVVEVVINPLNTTFDPISNASFIAGPAMQTLRLTNATQSVTFSLVPSNSEDLTEPVNYRISWRTGLSGPLFTQVFAMPNLDVNFADLHDLGEIIDDLHFLKEADLGVAGRVAKLNAQGKVTDAFGNVVDGTGGAEEVRLGLVQEISDRKAADAALNTTLTNQISNQVTAATSAQQTALNNSVAALTATANADRSTLGLQISTVSGRVTVIESVLPRKADLVDGRVPLHQAPLVTIGASHAATNQAAMLGLPDESVAIGDICVRPDGTWMLTKHPTGLLSNWTQITSPSDTVTSVNGKVGVVTLKASDVGAWSNASLLPQNAIQSLPTDLASIRANVAGNTASLASTVHLNESGVIDDVNLSTTVAFLNAQNQVVNKAGQVVIVSGNVSSVNGKSGAVVLTAANVNAYGIGSPIPMTGITGLNAALADKVNTTDSSVTNARTPLPHSASHATGGPDAITPSAIGAMAANAVIPQSQVSSLQNDLGLKADQASLQITNNQVQKNTVDIANLQAAGPGGPGNGVPTTVIAWNNGSSTDPYTATPISPFGYNSTSGAYFNSAGSVAGEGAWPYVTPNGRIEVRRLNPNAPVDPVPATVVDIADLQTKINSTNSTISTLATKTALNATNATVSGLQTTVASLAPTDNPSFTGTVLAPNFRMTQGGATITANHVLTTDASGNATWKAVPVLSVAGKTGAVALVQADIANLTADLGLLAPKANPSFTGQVTTVGLRVTGGTPGAGKTLVSDGNGVATWQVPPTAPVSSVAGHTGDVTLVISDVSGLQTALTAKADLVGGFIPTSQIPALALNTVVTAANLAGMLALTTSQVQPGDMCIITGGSDRGNYILTANDPSNQANWTPLVLPANAVSSINGKTGVVVLSASDVGAIAIGAAIPQSQITNLTTDLAAKLDASALNSYSTTTATQAQMTSKPTVKWVSRLNIASLSSTPSIDGTVVAVGDRVLLTNQSSSSANGFWVVNAGAWTRPTDMPVGGTVVPGTTVIVTNGASDANTVWQMTSASASTNVGTTPQAWSLSLRAGPPIAYTGGPGIQINGTTISANLGTGLAISGSAITVDMNAVVQKKVLPVPGGSTTATLTHNLNVTYVSVQIIETGSGNLVLAGVTITSANTVSVEFQNAPSSGQYTALIFG